jgi:peptidyl-prolyl cis-trans isomerase SurA
MFLQVIVVVSAAEAQQIFDRLKNGEDFVTLAKEKSVDATASAGGYMGELTRQDLRAELRDALQGLAPGEISKVVRIPSGYAILKVLTSPPPEASPASGTAMLGLPDDICLSAVKELQRCS